MIQTPKRQHSVSSQSLHAAHGYTLSTHDPIQRLKDLLKNPNDDYWFVHPPVWTAADEKDDYEDPEEPHALVCFYCSEPNDDKCGCAATYGAYQQTECLWCPCDYKRRFQGSSWGKPCDLCVPAYRADYVAHRAAVDSCKARLEDLRRQAEELTPAFLALLPAEQAALLEECGPCNIRVKEVLEEDMTASQIYDMELHRRPP